MKLSDFTQSTDARSKVLLGLLICCLVGLFYPYLFLAVPALIAIYYALPGNKQSVKSVVNKDIDYSQYQNLFNPSTLSAAPRSKPTDYEVAALQKKYIGKFLVEELLTQVNRHQVFWIGRSKLDPSEIRIGVRYHTGATYFFAENNFMNDARLQSYKIMTPEEADEVELRIKLANQRRKESRKAERGKKGKTEQDT